MYLGHFNSDGFKHGYGIQIGKRGIWYFSNFSNGRYGPKIIMFDSRTGDCYFIKWDVGNNTMISKTRLNITVPAPFDVGHYYMRILPLRKKEYDLVYKSGVLNNGLKYESYRCEMGPNDDRADGYGTTTWSDGEVYAGEWENGSRTGTGLMYHNNGEIAMGNFERGKRHGTFFLKRADGDVFLMRCTNNLAEGPAVSLSGQNVLELFDYTNNHPAKSTWVEITPEFSVILHVYSDGKFVKKISYDFR